MYEKGDNFHCLQKKKKKKSGWSTFFGLSGFHKEISPSCENIIFALLKFPLFALEGGCVD